MPEPHDSEPPDRSSDEQMPDSASTPESASDANPYQPPPSADLAPADVPAHRAEDSQIDYPGGMRYVVAMGMLVGILVTLAFLELVDRVQSGAAFVVPLIMWVAGFAALGAALRGSTQQRVQRAALLAVASVPAAILYVPVCSAGFLALSAGIEPQLAVGLSSTITVLLIMTLAAVILRAVTRARMRRGYVPPTSSQDASPNE